MMSVMHIVILIHKHDPFDRLRYFLYEMSKVWIGDGHRITVLNDPGEDVSADLAILHVDLTRVPADYIHRIARYPASVNASVRDISKRKISNSLVRYGDGYDGRVIVKTNRNCGGSREVHLAKKSSSLRKRAYRLRKRLPWTLQATLETADYLIFDSPREVPRTVWLNRDLVVEKFRPEQRNGRYHLRTWIFFGDRETNSLCYSNEPIVKSSNIIGREPVPEVPDEIREMRRDLGFEFGKFDYVITEDGVVLYDANRTPTFGDLPSESALPGVRELAKGLDSLL